MSSKDDEEVLGVDRALLDAVGSFQGFRAGADEALDLFLKPESHSFRRRGEVEEDPSWKQLIPYALFCSEGRILRYRRGSKSGEQRLAGKGSIGIGGHVNREDFAGKAEHLGHEAYFAGVAREVQEELQLGEVLAQRIVGLINDDTTPVGAVHLGVVHVFDLAAPEAASNEDAIIDVEFLTTAELEAERESLEAWSQICLDHLPEILGQ